MVSQKLLAAYRGLEFPRPKGILYCLCPQYGMCLSPCEPQSAQEATTAIQKHARRLQAARLVNAKRHELQCRAQARIAQVARERAAYLHRKALIQRRSDDVNNKGREMLKVILGRYCQSAVTCILYSASQYSEELSTTSLSLEH